MRTLIAHLISLYPKRWRDRYQSEFEALLDDTPLRWTDSLDILRSSIAMQLARLDSLKFLAAAGFVGTLIAAGFASTQPVHYSSSGLIATNFADPAAPDPKLVLFWEAFNRRFLSELIRNHNLYPDLDNHPMEDRIQRMRASIIVERADPNNLRVKFSYPDPATAQRVTEELLNHIVITLPNTQPLQIRAQPAVKVIPAGPARGLIVLAGLTIGLLAGALFIGLRRRPLAYSIRAALCGVTGMALFFGASSIAPARYRSTTSLRINRTEWPLVDQALAGLTDRRDFDNITSRKIVESQNYVVLELAYTAWDRFVARRTLSDAAIILVHMVDVDLSTRRPPQFLPAPNHLISAPLEFIDPALLPQNPVGPSRLTITLTGLACGLFAGALRSERQYRRRAVPG